MLRKISLVIVLLLIVGSASWAANKMVATSDANKVALNLSADEPLGGVVVALKFAEPGTDIICTKADFTGGIADYIADDGQSGAKFSIIDNEKKTILAVAIPFTANAIPQGEGTFLNLEFKGTGNVKLEETTISHQTGISLVNTKAQELKFDFNPIELTAPKVQALPKDFSLSQNYPNPFNPTTTISYALPANAYVKLVVYNILGQKVKTLVDEEQTAGYRQVVWNGQNDRGGTVGSGIYFYRIQAGSFTKTAKMSLLK
jgi:hypothetical protein